MSSIPLYKAFIEVGASEESATKASEDVIQVSQLPQLATKADIALLKSDIALVKSDISLLENKITADIAILEKKVTADIGSLRSDMADREARLVKWIVGCGLLYAGIAIAGVSIVV